MLIMDRNKRDKINKPTKKTERKIDKKNERIKGERGIKWKINKKK